MSFFRLFANACAGTGGRMGALLVLLLLASCGGNASRVEPFRPTRFVAFGDEFSMIVDTSANHNGHKYTINAVDVTTGNDACYAYPIWSQYLAQNFGFVFSECDPNGVGTNAARISATYKARVADVATQVAAYQSAQGFDSTTLVTVFAGMWDIIDAYTAWKNGTLTDQAAFAQVEAKGAQLGALVNQITNRGNGGRVVYLPMFDLGLTPFAATEDAVRPGARAMLSTLSCKFNTGNVCNALDVYAGFRGTVTNNGYWAGVIGTSAVPYPISTMAVFTANPNAFNLTNVNSAACLSTTLPLNCTNRGYSTGALTDVVPGAVDTGGVVRYLWADELHFSPSAHTYIGTFAVTIAQNNPF